MTQQYPQIDVPKTVVDYDNTLVLAQPNDYHSCHDARSKKSGCCWEVHATRADPEESLSSLCQVSKCLILTHPTKRLYDDSTAHLLCSNYWVQPIYQELLHSSSRYNATRTGEKNRPSNGLARTSAHPRPPKKLKPAASGTRFTDWIGGICHADTLQVWFPALGPCGGPGGGSGGH